MLGTLKLLAFIEFLLGSGILLFYVCLAKPMRSLITPGWVALILCIPVVGLFGRDKNVFYLLLLVLPLLAVGDRRRLAYLVVLTLPLFPDLSENYIVGPLYLLEFSAWKALSLGTLVAMMFVRGPSSRGTVSINLAVWLFFAVTILLTATGQEIGGVARVVAVSVLTILPFYYVVVRCIRTGEDAAHVTLFFLLGAVCNAIVALFEARRSWPLYQAFYTSLHMDFGLSSTLSIRAGFLRAQGAITSPTALGILLAMALIACVALRPRFTAAGHKVLLAVLAIGIVVAQSRGAYIAAAAGLATYLLYTRRHAALAGFAVIALFGFTVSHAVSNDSRLGALLGRSGNAQFTADYRSDLFTRGVEEVRKHPLRGQTKEQLEVSMDDMRQGQRIIDFVNTPLFVALKTGILGLVGWLIAWGVPFAATWRQRRTRASAAEYDVAIGLPAAMITCCFVALIFTSMIDRIVPLTMIGFGLASGGLYSYRRRRKVDLERAIPVETRRRGSLPLLRPFGGITSATQ